MIELFILHLPFPPFIAKPPLSCNNLLEYDALYDLIHGLRNSTLPLPGFEITAFAACSMCFAACLDVHKVQDPVNLF